MKQAQITTHGETTSKRDYDPRRPHRKIIKVGIALNPTQEGSRIPVASPTRRAQAEFAKMYGTKHRITYTPHQTSR